MKRTVAKLVCGGGVELSVGKLKISAAILRLHGEWWVDEENTERLGVIRNF